jgi:predicted RecB family nuclease
VRGLIAYVGEGGFEYLLGYVTTGDAPEPHYTGCWSLSREDERRNFEQFVGWVMERWRQHPGLHVYHFAPYEPGALMRVAAAPIPVAVARPAQSRIAKIFADALTLKSGSGLGHGRLKAAAQRQRNRDENRCR